MEEKGGAGGKVMGPRHDASVTDVGFYGFQRTRFN